MKKIIFGILILFVAVFHVNAKEIYYSDYSDFSEYTLEKIDSSELINVETERRYRFYEKIEVGEFRRVHRYSAHGQVSGRRQRSHLSV